MIESAGCPERLLDSILEGIMALVKKSKISADAAKPAFMATSSPAAPGKAARHIKAMPRNQTISERVAAATEELASGLTQASAATKELGRSMEQIASGAEEAAGASQEQSSAIKRIVANLAAARVEAEAAGRRSETVLATLGRPVLRSRRRYARSSATPSATWRP